MPDDQPSSSEEAFADRVESALESLWRGESDAFDRLLSGSDDGAARAGVGGLIDGFIASAESTRPPRAPDVEGYCIQREIGRGGMGVVYGALQAGTKRQVALKVILAGPFASDVALRRFQREVELAARFRHPGIVSVLESGELPSGQRYYAMEYVEGVTLDRYLADTRPDLPTILRLFESICDAVEHAHAHGVVHRDLKPGNILIDGDGRPNILDFGLAKATDHSADDTLAQSVSLPGQILGTLRYLSPEQAAGNHDDIDARTDVHALGVLLFEALTGGMPFDMSGRPSEIMQRIVEAPAARPTTISDHVDADCETIVLKALEKDPARRYQSAAALGEDLRRRLSGETILARRASGIYRLRRSAARNRRRLTIVVAALAFVVLGLMGGTWLKDLAAQRSEHRQLERARSQALRLQHLVEVGRFGDALGPAQALYEKNPGVPEALLVYAQARYRTGRTTANNDFILSAISMMKNAASREPSSWATGLLLRAVLEETGGAPRPEEGAVRMPDTAEAWYLRSFACLDATSAVACAEQAVQRDGEHALAWERLAYLRLRSGDFDRVRAAVGALIRIGADTRRWMAFDVEVLTRGGRLDDALARCDDLVARYPEWSKAYRYRAVARLCRREYLAAAGDYGLAIERAPRGGVWEVYGRATALWILGRFDEATADYRAFRAANDFVSFADIRLYLVLEERIRQFAGSGESARIAELRDEQRTVLDAARRGAPPDSGLSRILTCIAGELPESALIDAANPENAEEICEAFYYAGEVCLLDDRPAEALGWFRKCVETNLPLDPDSSALDPMSEYHLAVWRLGTLETGGDAGSS